MKQIIVVEGIHDEMQIKSIYPDANCLTTNGREISEATLSMIEKLSKDNEIILLLDPDTPGEKIRSLITKIVPNALQAFIPKRKCISNNHKKVGIEHASKENIIKALDNLYRPMPNNDDLTVKDLYNLKLIGFPHSGLLRENVSNKLNIGKPNAKTFLKRLNMFNITFAELEGIVKLYE